MTVHFTTTRKATVRAGRRIAVALCLLTLGVLALGCAPKEPLLTEQQRQLNVESFEYAWATIRDKHWDPELGGLDWPAVHDELKPRVEQAKVMSAVRAAMSDMIKRLEQSHFAIIPAEAYEDLNRPAGEGGRDGATGLDVRVIDGQALVTKVEPGSPADEQGVRLGWRIVSIDGEKLEPVIKRVGEAFAESTARDYRLAAAVTVRLGGPVGHAVRVRFLDGADHPVDLEFELAQRKGHKVQLGHLPAQYVWLESRLLEGNVGYIIFNMFLDPLRVMKGFGDAVESFMDSEGIVIDLRGNAGGIGPMAMGMAGWLVSDESKYLGTMHTRTTDLKFVVNPQVEVYDGPVAILIDGLSGSNAEIMAGGMKDLGRARLFGTTTAGAALPATIEKLPNGDGFMYAMGNYVSASGEVLEGRGAIPHEEVALTRESLLAGRDLVLEAALRWIQKQN